MTPQRAWKCDPGTWVVVLARPILRQRAKRPFLLSVRLNELLPPDESPLRVLLSPFCSVGACLNWIGHPLEIIIKSTVPAFALFSGSIVSIKPNEAFALAGIWDFAEMGSSPCSIFPQFQFHPESVVSLMFPESTLNKVSGGWRLRQYPSCNLGGGYGGTELFGCRLLEAGADRRTSWSFARGSTVVGAPRTMRYLASRKAFGVNSSWLASSQLASSAFTMGTVAVLPFYTLMVVAPKAELTRKCVHSSVPFIGLGLLYAYLLYLSWTPDTLRLMFASKYWLPELPGIARMFSNEMTLASAWIHLLAVDLFAARQIFHDGLENNIETRHSVSLCLLFCPVGITAHFITKALTDRARND